MSDYPVSGYRNARAREKAGAGRSTPQLAWGQFPSSIGSEIPLSRWDAEAFEEYRRDQQRRFNREIRGALNDPERLGRLALSLLGRHPGVRASSALLNALDLLNEGLLTDETGAYGVAPSGYSIYHQCSPIGADPCLGGADLGTVAHSVWFAFPACYCAQNAPTEPVNAPPYVMQWVDHLNPPTVKWRTIQIFKRDGATAPFPFQYPGQIIFYPDDPAVDPALEPWMPQLVPETAPILRPAPGVREIPLPYRLLPYRQRLPVQMPGFAREVGPVRQPRTETNAGPTIDFTPGNPPVVSPPSRTSGVPRRPPRFEKQAKLRPSFAMLLGSRGPLRALGVLTETLDALYCIWNAIPKGAPCGKAKVPPRFNKRTGGYSKGKPTPQRALADIYNCWGHIQWTPSGGDKSFKDSAFGCMAQEFLEDLAIAKVSKGVSRKFPGAQSGPAL